MEFRILVAAGLCSSLLVFFGSGGELRAEGVADQYQMVQGGTLIADGAGGNPGGLLSNDSGVRNFQPGEFVGEGVLTVVADGTFRYQPPANFFGTTTFSYQVGEFEESTYLSGDDEWKILFQADDPAGTDADFHSTWFTSTFDDVNQVL